MKIGIECHTIEKKQRLGAGGNYLLNLLKEWSKIETDQDQFILYFKEYIPKIDFLNKPHFIKRIVKTPIKSTALYYNIALPAKAKKDKADILFLPFYMRPFFCFTPTVTAIHDISFKTHPEWFAWNYKIPFKILTKKAIKTSKRILACSQYTKQETIRNYKIKEEKVKTIYLAANKEFNNQKEEQEIKKAKEKYNIKNKYIFFTGTIFNRRHVLESIKAFKEIKNENYQFLISGRNFTNPKQKIKEGNKIIRTDFVEYKDLPHIYKGADLFIWLSTYEGFGLPVLEAMQSGTPVLTTKETSLKEVIGDYPIYIKDSKNIKEIKEKMKKILTNQELKQECINKGLEQAKKFSWEKTAKQTLKEIKNENNTN
ncbi:MAG: glycosyltransferase [Candidatus Portnoybacteria bacterium]|nr:glycosyltransferase [Candidatus Portnoybacteria bacterium]